MKLESFKEKNTKKKAIIVGSVFVVLLISVIVLIRSFALFETKQEYDVIKGSVGNYSPSDITITSYVDGSPSKTFPTKDSEYRVDKVECSNEARGLWNYTNWEVNLSNLTTTGTKCKVYFVKSYKETILNGTDPVISENLIPVTIEANGTVKKADMTSEWYKYENKVWANAVILEDESIVYQNGEVIPETNIESYFVWIPKYQYKLWDLGNYSSVDSNSYNRFQTIEIKFGLTNTVDNSLECKTPMESGKSGNCSVGKYMTHPAFLSIPSSGFWFGKFETGYKGATAMDEMKNEFNLERITVKANQYSWRWIQQANAHLNSFNYQRNLDSHMSKNTEWGAVAYLTYTKYGQNKNLRINNNSNILTGYGSTTEVTCGYTNSNEACNRHGTTSDITLPYNTSVGNLASTTGNISGVYDMAGGISEYVMGIMADANGQPVSGTNSTYKSGFNGVLSHSYNDGASIMIVTDGVDFPNSKYYDLYQFKKGTGLDFTNRILGDASGELGPIALKIYNTHGRRVNSWNENVLEQSVSILHPVISRGYSLNGGINSGVLAFQGGYGSASANSYRIVLTP